MCIRYPEGPSLKFFERAIAKLQRKQIFICFQPTPRIGVAIGDWVLDVTAVKHLFSPELVEKCIDGQVGGNRMCNFAITLRLKSKLVVVL